jgi:hypothetical protein
MDAILCPVCRTSLGERVAVCARCETPHHPECWEFGERCAVFACGGTQGVVVPMHERPLLDQATVVLENNLPDPPARTASPCVAGRRMYRESQVIALISWIYLGCSLVWAIPSVATLLLGLISWNAVAILSGIALSMGALGLKGLGDLIAVGDPRGRAIHLCLVFLATLMIPGVESLFMLLLAIPFFTRSGAAHFGNG